MKLNKNKMELKKILNIPGMKLENLKLEIKNYLNFIFEIKIKLDFKEKIKLFIC